MTNTLAIDATDARILCAIDDDPTASVLGIARVLGLARNTVHARLSRMEREGVLGEPSRRLRMDALGYGLTAFVEMSIDQTLADEAYEALANIPEILEAHATTGDADLLVKVVARDTADLHRVTTLLVVTPGVMRTSTALSLTSVIPPRMSALLRRQAGPTVSRSPGSAR